MHRKLKKLSYKFVELHPTCMKIFIFMLIADFRARRAAKEAKDAPAQPAPEKARVDIKKFVKIGRPGYKVTKQRDPDTGQQSLLFQVRKHS